MRFDLRVGKGQINLKEDWHTIDSPKKRMNEFVCFFLLFYSSWQKKTNSFVQFLGESTARKSAYGFIWPLSIQRQIKLGYFFQISNTSWTLQYIIVEFSGGFEYWLILRVSSLTNFCCNWSNQSILVKFCPNMYQKSQFVLVLKKTKSECTAKLQHF